MIPTPARQECAKAYVYLLRSVRTGKYYVGCTTNLERRVRQHNEGQGTYTRKRGIWVLIGYKTYGSFEQARLRERSLKRSTRMLSMFKKRTLASFRGAADFSAARAQVWG